MSQLEQCVYMCNYIKYMVSESYSMIQSFISESLYKAKDNIVFHETNSCPDLWKQIRIIGDVKIAPSSCAQSLIKK